MNIISSNTSFTVPALPATAAFKVFAIQRVRTTKGWNVEQAATPFYHLWYVVTGRAIIKYNDGVFELHPGSAHLVAPYTPHNCRCEDSFDCYQLHFLSLHESCKGSRSALENKQQVNEKSGLGPFFERLWAICSTNDLSLRGQVPEEYPLQSIPSAQNSNGVPLAQDTESQSIMQHLVEPFLASEQTQVGARLLDEPFPAVKEYIKQHLAEPIMLADLAQIAGLHPTYFSDLFQQQTGIRPLEYLTRQRMNHAGYLLRRSNTSIKEVAYNVGLRDPAYFSRVFLKYYHVSPSAYRATYDIHRRRDIMLQARTRWTHQNFPLANAVPA